MSTSERDAADRAASAGLREMIDQKRRDLNDRRSSHKRALHDRIDQLGERISKVETLLNRKEVAAYPVSSAYIYVKIGRVAKDLTVPRPMVAWRVEPNYESGQGDDWPRPMSGIRIQETDTRNSIGYNSPQVRVTVLQSDDQMEEFLVDRFTEALAYHDHICEQTVDRKLLRHLVAGGGVLAVLTVGTLLTIFDSTQKWYALAVSTISVMLAVLVLLALNSLTKRLEKPVPLGLSERGWQTVMALCSVALLLVGCAGISHFIVQPHNGWTYRSVVEAYVYQVFSSIPLLNAKEIFGIEFVGLGKNEPWRGVPQAFFQVIMVALVFAFIGSWWKSSQAVKKVRTLGSEFEDPDASRPPTKQNAGN